MAKGGREFIANQVFVGLPWKNVRPKYEKIIRKLESKFPLYFTIIGRNDGQDAGNLFEIIKQRVASSSVALFDATGGNANVSLEYGYAEGIEVPRVIYLSTHKAAQQKAGDPIISDLGGKRRIQYKTESGLSTALQKFSKEHDYTQRFERALSRAFPDLTKGKKRRMRTLAIKLIHAFDGYSEARRAEVVQKLQAQGYTATEIESMLRKLHSAGVILCTVGRTSKIRVA